jgi:hypothetical protein
MSVTSFAPSASAAPSNDPTAGGSPMAGGGAGGGQGTQIIQQIQGLLQQLGQATQQPAVQHAIDAINQVLGPIAQAVGAEESGPQGSMSSGLANPTGGDGSTQSSAPAGPDNMGESGRSSEGTKAGPSSFAGAKKAAMANHAEKGHFSKSGSKGEQLQTDKTKNRTKAK